MASEITTDELSRLSSLLDRKLENIPEHHLPTITVNDILQATPRAVRIMTLPADIQLPYFLRNRSLINRDNERPIKDERKQPLKITRTIFFYHLSETYQFQRFHDISRWNLAMFTALLCTTAPSAMPSTPTQSFRKKEAPASKVGDVSPAARRFMTTYLAAVIERHNTPAIFDRREEFIRRWKDSNMDLYGTIKSSQQKLLKKALLRLKDEWEHELDRAIRELGERQYNARVAPFAGNIIPGRKDQGLPPNSHGHARDFARSALPSPEAREEADMDRIELVQGRNELLEALCVPLEDRKYQDDDGYEEEVNTPVDIRYAIASVQSVRPADMLPALMQLFPVHVEEREGRWNDDLAERSDM